MSEKSAPLLIKVVTVLIAIGLASGYIVYRKNMAARPSSDAGSSNDSAEVTTGDTDPPEADPVIIMSSSKSEVLPLKEMTPELRRALMSSSKSGLILPLPEEEEEDQAQQKPQRTLLPGSKNPSRTVMPSSKRIDAIFRPAPEPEEP